MSDELKHECGIAHIRLLKPLDFYKKKYGSAFYGINKMYLLMEKQHNRGQDGAGFASIQLDVDPGKKFISRIRSIEKQPIQDVFSKILFEVSFSISLLFSFSSSILGVPLSVTHPAKVDDKIIKITTNIFLIFDWVKPCIEHSKGSRIMKIIT